MTDESADLQRRRDHRVIESMRAHEWASEQPDPDPDVTAAFLKNRSVAVVRGRGHGKTAMLARLKKLLAGR